MLNRDLASMLKIWKVNRLWILDTVKKKINQLFYIKERGLHTTATLGIQGSLVLEANHHLDQEYR